LENAYVKAFSEDLNMRFPCNWAEFTCIDLNGEIILRFLVGNWTFVVEGGYD
jgi:hypothetical protein